MSGRERETRRNAFRRQLWELRRNTPVSNGTGRSCVVSTNGPHRVRDRVRPPIGRQGGKGTMKGAGRGTPPGTAAAFCGGATMTAKPLSPHTPTLRSWSWLRDASLYMCARARDVCVCVCTRAHALVHVTYLDHDRSILVCMRTTMYLYGREK